VDKSLKAVTHSQYDARPTVAFWEIIHNVSEMCKKESYLQIMHGLFNGMIANDLE